MLQRKRFWLYDYDQVKYRTPLQWGILLVVSFIFATFGSAVALAVVTQYRSEHTLNVALIAVTAAFLAAAVIEFPAAVIFFYRRRRGEIMGYFDYEVLADANHGRNEVDHGSDHR
jgi:uncharacterized membrane protein